jgi:hypothetical protein
MNNKRNGSLTRAKALTTQQRSEIGKKGAKKEKKIKIYL